MATLRADDGVNLYDEDTGSGTPIVFVHQYVGDPTLFNQLVEEFFHPVEGGHWRARES